MQLSGPLISEAIYYLVFGIARTLDVGECQIIGIIQTIDFGDCLLIGIVRTTGVGMSIK